MKTARRVAASKKRVQEPKRRVQAPQKRGQAPRPARFYAAGIAIAIAVAAGLVLASQFAQSTRRNPTAATIVGAADNGRLFAGIPQRGNVLGSSRAPVTLVEYADLQCPYCGQFARETLPKLVNDYVRPGHVRMVFRGLSFLGPDSRTALGAALAAGRHGRLWNLTHLIYVNQGEENTGWVTDGYLHAVAAAVPGVDPSRLLSEARSPSIAGELAELEGWAAVANIHGTPTFEIGRTRGQLRRLEHRTLGPEAFRPALDYYLNR